MNTYRINNEPHLLEVLNERIMPGDRLEITAELFHVNKTHIRSIAQKINCQPIFNEHFPNVFEDGKIECVEVAFLK